MLLGELLDDERREAWEEGMAEGRAEGRRQLLALIRAMIADGQAGEIPRLDEEPAYLEEMLEKYHIS